jgi:hypothetical protein
MVGIGTGLLVMAYVLAVVDGITDRHLLFEGKPMGLKRFLRYHPWIAAGAVCGIAGTVLVTVGS